ncbi:hypothetical protein PIB30_058671 [Stylosanthes scabra]|uniref:Uncharacterized protein n=1 Tax=Stylosanthes scabra TaxID=79078 RepID=A0ABU6RKD2_9FABA|nr:hypothetical protein [Stylosanthes scabra]
MEYGGGSGSGSGSQLGDKVPPSHRYGPPSDMYELFSCGEQTMDQIAHGVSVLPALPAVVPSYFITAAVSAALAPLPDVLPAFTAAVVSFAFMGTATLPVHRQLSLTIPAAPARRLNAPGCPLAGTEASEGSPSAPYGTSSHLHHWPGHEGDRD